MVNELVQAVLKRTAFNVINTEPEIVSWHHRRSVSLKLKDGYWLSIKGIGWAHGPPWQYLSPKDPELCFGLLDKISGDREVLVSKMLQEINCLVTNSAVSLPLSPQELRLIGITQPLRFNNRKFIDPVVLFTVSRSRLRICDFTPRLYDEWLKDIHKHHDVLLNYPSSCYTVLEKFARKLSMTICLYQKAGAVNDSLSPDNVTIAAEVTDFEWFYMPGIPLPDGTEDIFLEARQRKEAFYFIDVLVSLCDGLKINIPIYKLAEYGLQPSESSFNTCGFLKQLRELSIF